MAANEQFRTLVRSLEDSSEDLKYLVLERDREVVVRRQRRKLLSKVGEINNLPTRDAKNERRIKRAFEQVRGALDCISQYRFQAARGRLERAAANLEAVADDDNDTPG
jgi:hypothetical protein